MNLLEFGAQGGARLCGPGRTHGDTYIECGLQLGARPVEAYLIDPPSVLDPEEWGIQAVGMSTLTDADGVLHLLDWVGQEHYPFIPDVLEEARRMGISRKVPRTLDLKGLSDRSRILLIHPRGSVANFTDYTPLTDFRCPCGHDHQAGQDCIGLHWRVTPTEPDGTRRLAGGHYALKPRPVGLPAPTYDPAVFASFPITNLTVINGPDQTQLVQRVTTLRTTTALPVVVKDE